MERHKGRAESAAFVFVRCGERRRLERETGIEPATFSLGS
jgi:hypothetical protein